ncbi:hypothetical protein AAMO2058_000184300 [Amorphochlora amoebiformis]
MGMLRRATASSGRGRLASQCIPRRYSFARLPRVKRRVFRSQIALNSTNNTNDSKENERIPWKEVSVLVTSQFIVNSGFGFVIPVLPSFAAELGMGPSGVGIILSSPAMVRILVNQPLGRAADRWGRRPLMVAGTLIMAASSVGTGMATTFSTMVPFRLLMGIGTAASTAGSQAYMADLTDRVPTHRAKLLGLQQTAITAAFVGGPVLGGFLTHHLGIRMGFFASGIAAAACCVGYSMLKETLQLPKKARKSDRDSAATSPGDADASNTAASSHEDGKRNNSGRHSWFRLLQGSSSISAVTGVNFSLYLGYACMLTVLPMYAKELWGANEFEIGMIFSGVSALGFIGGPLAGWAADRFGRKAVVVPSALFIASGAGLMSMVDSKAAFLAALFVWGVGNSMITPGITAFAVDHAPEDQKGNLLSLTRQAGDLAFLVGPVGLGALAEYTSYSHSLTLTSAVMLATGSFFWLKAKEVPKAALKRK